MRHFNAKIEGWFTWPRLYRDMVRRFPNGSRFVEVGVFKGKSLAYLLVEIINANKNISVTAVDSFSGELGYGRVSNLLQAFLSCMSPVQDKFNLETGNSWDVASKFKDKSLDLVFLDAAHEYESVKKDILAWTPKIKEGGIIAGHDYPDYEGVKMAVDEIFGDSIDRSYVNEGCWLMNIV